MFEQLKVTTRVDPEAKEFFKIIIFSIIIFLCFLVLGTLIYFIYNPPQSRIGGSLLCICYSLLVGYIFGSWWPSKFKSYFNKLIVNTNELNSQLENDCLYELIKINPDKYAPELSSYLMAWKSEIDEKEKSKVLRKLSALFDLYWENQNTKALSKSTKTTYEKIIGTLIDISTLNGTITPQTRIIEEIIDLYHINSADKKGLSERNIAGILSDSNLIHKSALIKRAHQLKVNAKLES